MRAVVASAAPTRTARTAVTICSPVRVAMSRMNRAPGVRVSRISPRCSAFTARHFLVIAFEIIRQGLGIGCQLNCFNGISVYYSDMFDDI